MSPEYTLQEIESLRDRRYHRTPGLRVRTEQEALSFVDEVGFCFLFGEKNIEIPTLWQAVAGSRREVPRHHHDPDLGRTWSWKDTLPSKGLIFYGKLLRKKPTLVSLKVLPYFYALSLNYGEVNDYLDQYEAGKLGAEAKNVYEALLGNGPLSTTRLRQLAGLSGGGDNARRFERAVTELQTELKIAKVGISQANRWKYAYVYDLFMHSYPDVPEQARHISTDEAMDHLLVLHLRNVIAQPEKQVQRLLRWPSWEWDRLIQRLTDRGVILCDQSIAGLGTRCLAIARELV